MTYVNQLRTIRVDLVLRYIKSIYFKLNNMKSNKELLAEMKRISKEIKTLSLKLKEEGFKNHHDMARCEANKKYGKGWREELQMQMTYKKGELDVSYF